MPARYRRSSRSYRAPRRRLEWAYTTPTGAINVAGGDQVNADLTAPIQFSTAAGSPGCTIMRTIVHITFTNQSIADVFNVGLIVGRLRDVNTAGTATSPNPVDVSSTGDSRLDWAWQDSYYANAQGSAFNAVQLIDFDTKVRRKLHDPSDRWLLVMQNPAGTNRSWTYSARCLVALP